MFFHLAAGEAEASQAWYPRSTTSSEIPSTIFDVICSFRRSRHLLASSLPGAAHLKTWWMAAFGTGDSGSLTAGLAGKPLDLLSSRPFLFNSNSLGRDWLRPDSRFLGLREFTTVREVVP